jgi:heme/copper-type cytochrome/quinol oxidase subunit 3
MFHSVIAENENEMNQKLRKIWLLIVPRVALLLKDIIATMAVLSTEPGITANTVRLYAIALLPGALFFGTSQYAFVFNIVFGALLGLILYLRVIRRKS